MADTLTLTLANGDRVRLHRPYAEAILPERLEAFVRDKLHAQIDPQIDETWSALLGYPVVIGPVQRWSGPASVSPFVVLEDGIAMPDHVVHGPAVYASTAAAQAEYVRQTWQGEPFHD